MTPAADPILEPPQPASSSARKSWACVIITLVLAALPILNIGSYVVAATILGGDAINGHAHEGHYFLRSDGKDTEVSRTVFNYSRIHTYSVWATVALFLLGGVAALLLKALAFLLNRRNRYKRL